MIKMKIENLLTEAEFDVLYDSSISYLERGYFPWPADITITDTDKRCFLYNLISKLLEADVSLLIKCFDGDILVGVLVGYTNSNTYHNTHGLYRPDNNGSRAFVYDPAFMLTLKQTLSSVGIDSAFGYMVANTSMADGAINRRNLSEYETLTHSLPHIHTHKIVKIPLF